MCNIYIAAKTKNMLQFIKMDIYTFLTYESWPDF